MKIIGIIVLSLFVGKLGYSQEKKLFYCEMDTGFSDHEWVLSRYDRFLILSGRGEHRHGGSSLGEFWLKVVYESDDAGIIVYRYLKEEQYGNYHWKNPTVEDFNSLMAAVGRDTLREGEKNPKCSNLVGK